MTEDYPYAIVIPEEVLKDTPQKIALWMIEQVGRRLQKAISEEMQNLKEQEKRHHENARQLQLDGASQNIEEEHRLAREAHLKHNGAEMALAKVTIATNYAKSDTIMYVPKKE